VGDEARVFCSFIACKPRTVTRRMAGGPGDARSRPWILQTGRQEEQEVCEHVRVCASAHVLWLLADRMGIPSRPSTTQPPSRANAGYDSHGLPNGQVPNLNQCRVHSPVLHQQTQAFVARLRDREQVI